MKISNYTEYQRLANSINSDMENCPLKLALEALRGKWSLRILFELSKRDAMRFGELKKRLGEVTNTVLTNALRNLEDVKLVNRIQYNEIPLRVEYSLTEAGRELYPVFIALVQWGEKYFLEEVGHSIDAP